MGIYFLMLFAVMFLWPVNSRMKFTINGIKLYDAKKIYVSGIGFLLFLEAALRDYTVGTDVYTYLRRYVTFSNTEWRNIFSAADVMMFEHGFAVFNKVLSGVSDNPRFFLMVTAFFITFSFSLKIYYNSTIPWLSFFLFITLGLFGSSMNTIRQYIALAIVLYSYDAIKENRLFRFIGLMLLASSIHTSAVIVLPMFWISKIKFNKKVITIFMITVFGMLGLAVKYGEFLFALCAPYLFTYSRYIGQFSISIANGAVGATIIYLAFSVLVVAELYHSRDGARNMYIAFALMSVFLISFSFVISISARVVSYFSVMFVFSVPRAVKSGNKVKRHYLAAICVVTFVYYLAVICRADVSSLIPYKIWDCKSYVF